MSADGRERKIEETKKRFNIDEETIAMIREKLEEEARERENHLKEMVETGRFFEVLDSMVEVAKAGESVTIAGEGLKYFDGKRIEDVELVYSVITYIAQMRGYIHYNPEDYFQTNIVIIEYKGQDIVLETVHGQGTLWVVRGLIKDEEKELKSDIGGVNKIKEKDIKEELENSLRECSKIIEIDVDGVIADMDGYYKYFIGHLIPDFSEETHIFNWGMPEVAAEYPDVYKIIKGLWVNPGFIRTVPRYEGVEEALKELGEIAVERGYHIVVHTHIFNYECAKERREWLEELREDTGVQFEIDICVGGDKEMRIPSEVLIEDKLENLNNSKAKNKIMIARGHNRSYNESDIEGEGKKAKVKGLKEAVRYIREEIK